MKEICLSFLIFASSLVYAQSWKVTEVAPMPEAISNNAVVSAEVNGVPFVYSFSGIDTTKLYSGISLKSFRYNTQTDIWDTIAPLPDTLGKIAAGASAVNGKIYIIGGYYVFPNDNEKSSDHVHIYDPQTNQYLADGAPVPVPIDDQVQMVYKDSLIYVITGWSNTTNRNTVQIYNPALDQWSVGTSLPNTNTYKSFGSSGALIGDTIFYFAGAASSRNLPIQNVLRMGIIDPNDPTQISWSDTILDPTIRGYRMAATSVNGNVHWIGGSNQTYNYDGLAYSNGSGVPPNNRNLVLLPSKMEFASDTSQGVAYPMDVRGIAETSAFTRYLVGGMEANQKVSNKTLKLEYITKTIDLPWLSVTEPVVGLFPNPADQYVHVFLNKGIPDEVSLLDMSGRVVQKMKLDGNLLNVSNLPDGIYSIQIIINDQVYFQKLNLQH